MRGRGKHAEVLLSKEVNLHRSSWVKIY